MRKGRLYSNVTAVLLAVVLLFQPLCTPPVLDLFFGRTLQIAQAAPLAQDAAADPIFLPIIRKGDVVGGNPPDFVINSPPDGSSVGGTTFFAIQPTSTAVINSVSFRAGSTDLGTDTTASDGFRVFLNARNLTAGITELTATASGPGGQTSKSINVTLIPNPPQSATLDSSGGVLASEIGSVISILPGSVPAGTTVTIDELTQDETTARHGINWESMGVTFLGAQDVQSSAPISGPFGMVASAGFGNRVQPGQAVVNYRIAPDADGDGADEIVVVNTASVAPNGDVVADPRSAPHISKLWAVPSGLNQNPQEVSIISGPPGAIFEIETQGFNPISTRSTLAEWQSTLDGAKYEMPSIVLPDVNGSESQKVIVVIPPLLAGKATLTLRNLSTGYTTTPIIAEVKISPTLKKPSFQTIDEFLSQLIIYFDSLSTSSSEQWAATRTIVLLERARTSFADLVNGSSDPALIGVLDEMAAMIENSGIINILTPSSIVGSTDDGTDKSIGYGLGIGAALSTAALRAAALGIGGAGLALFGNILGLAIALAVIGYLICLWLGNGSCFDPPPSDNGGNGATGMGAAPPPGGNGGGNAGGGGGSKITAASIQQTSPVMVKIFSNGNRTPFTGMTDPGGYFFVPFIPQDEPFTALAIDTATGETRTFKGTGPATGESVFMFFDFFNDDGSGAQRIQIGDVITGTISVAAELDLFSFVATAGQRVFFDLQDYKGLSSQVNWQLTAPNGAEVFNTCFGCFEPGVKILTLPGTYILTVGDTRESSTGTYRFQLWNVPPPNEFTINIGDVISDSVPGPGAGRIEVPGAEDIYRFTATAGQLVFFDLQGYKGLSSQVNWRLNAPDGTVVFDTCLGCTEPGVKTLAQGGTYVLTVGDTREDSAGTYRFQLWNVPPPNEFTINIGDVISDSVPGPGAGRIEVPGAEDIYRFTATAGQLVFFDLQGYKGLSSQVNWRLNAPDGTEVFDNCLGCSEPGVKTLAQGGTYILTVGDRGEDSAGTYRFQLWNVPPPNEFTINIGDVISDSVPGPGAGRIEVPGAEDIYRFTATAGQRVLFDLQGYKGLSSQVNWRLNAPDGTVVFDNCLGCSEPGVKTLAQGGTYILTVGDRGEDSAGTYRFQTVAQP